MIMVLKRLFYSLFLFFILLLTNHFSKGFGLGSQASLGPALSWHTFLGSSKEDFSHGIAVDTQGNVYLTGRSDLTWGNPINPHSGGRDAFVLKLDKDGVELWHTFLGSSSFDEGRGIAVDKQGNVYIVGTSDETWGNPVHYHAGGLDTFAAKLNSKGALLWHTFMGHQNDDHGLAITVDENRNVYVGGWGGWFWDTMPVYPISGGEDGWIAKLKPGGVRDWYTIMGSTEVDSIQSIAVAPDGNIFVAGRSGGPWFTPSIHPFSGDEDAYVAKLDSDGRRLWHTFMGSTGWDNGTGVAIDECGNIFVSGDSRKTWGSPLSPFYDREGNAFLAKLKANGARLWNTFLGSRGGGMGWEVSTDSLGNAYVVSVSGNSNEVPLTHPGLFTAKLNPNGEFLWRTFIEAICGEGNSISLDSSGNVYLGGGGDVPWGEPVNPWIKRWDVFAAKIDRGIRVVSWNLLNYSGLNGDARDEAIRNVLEIIEPDILVVQEMESEYGVDHFLKEVLNVYSRRKYRAVNFYDGPDTDNALFYDKSRLQLMSFNQIPTSFRDVSEYSLAIKDGPSRGSEFKIYSVHFQEGRGASHKKQRENQANTLRTYLNGLSLDSNFIVCGTFNMTTNKEKAYKILTGSQSSSIGGDIGRLKDLMKKSGKWHDRAKFTHFHTESTRKSKFGGGVGGGLDDRYDMILISYSMEQNKDLTYMPGSCVVFGNDGKHLNKAINDPENKICSPDIADALNSASDHLPVIIDLVTMKDLE